MSTTMTPPAESSPAPVQTTVLAPQGEARAEWLKTGKIPESAKPNTEESAPSKESSAEGQQPEGKGAPAPEAGQKQERKRSDAATRLEELLQDLGRAGLTPAELKTFRKQAQQQAEPAKAAPEKTENPAPAESGLKPPVKPKAEDYEGKPWQEYEAARDKYFEDLADYKAAKAIQERDARQAAEKAHGEMQAKLTDATKRYGGEAGKTITATAQEIFSDSKVSPVVKNLLDGSPVFVDLLYAIGSNADSLNDFLATARENPGAAVRKLVTVEALVQAELAKGGKSEGKPEGETARGTDGKFKAPEKKTTDAPPPPTELSGQRSAPPDESEQAFKRGDARAFIEAENRKEIARRKGR